MSIVSFDQVSQRFGTFQALNNLSFQLDGGQVLGLFGHNGAGKTTSIKLILGLLKPTCGNVAVFDENPHSKNFNSRRYQIGFLPENVSFYQQQTGRQVLKFFAQLKKVNAQRVDDLLDQLELTFAANRKVKTYSKGMRQRLGLAQALLTKPSLLLLDEPTVGLDPVATRMFYQTLDRLKKDGCSIILCSHVLPELESHIDRALILAQGERRAYGSLVELRDQADLPHQITFTGCFDLQDLSNELNQRIETTQTGQFRIEVSARHKMAVVRTLMKNTGLKDIEVQAPRLQQMYHHFMGDGNIKHSDQSLQGDSQRSLTFGKFGLGGKR